MSARTGVARRNSCAFTPLEPLAGGLLVPQLRCRLAQLLVPSGRVGASLRGRRVSMTALCGWKAVRLGEAGANARREIALDQRFVAGR